MDISYGSPARDTFVTNVGLITSNGPHGHNIMAAEWTFQISYKPGIIAISLGPTKATTENISETGFFGVSIAAENQNILSSIAGGYTGKKTNKIELLEELGYTFHKAKDIDVLLPDGAMLYAECTVMEQKLYGDHVLIIGEATNIEADTSTKPVVCHRGKYSAIGKDIPKPSDEEREKMKLLAEKFPKGE